MTNDDRDVISVLKRLQRKAFIAMGMSIVGLVLSLVALAWKLIGCAP